MYRENTSAPPELEGILDQETFTKARLYALEKSQFGAVQGIFSQLLSTVLLWVLGYRLFWGWALDSLDALGQVVNYPHMSRFQVVLRMLLTVRSSPPSCSPFISPFSPPSPPSPSPSTALLW